MCYRLPSFRGKGQSQRFGTFWRHQSTKIDRLLHKTVPTFRLFSNKDLMIVQKQTLNTWISWSNMSLMVRKRVEAVDQFPTNSHTNQAVHPHKMARSLKFRIKVVEGLYFLCSEIKGTDQLRGYRETDLCLFFAYAIIRFS